MKIRIYVSRIFAVNARSSFKKLWVRWPLKSESSFFDSRFLLAVVPAEKQVERILIILPHSTSSRASFGWKPLILIDFMFLCREFPWRLIFHDPIFHSAQQSPGIYNLIYYIKHNYDFFHASFLDYRSISTANAPHTITINFSLAVGPVYGRHSVHGQRKTLFLLVSFPAQSRKTHKIVPHNLLYTEYHKAFSLIKRRRAKSVCSFNSRRRNFWNISR